ncbi:universal stress protein [Janibacter sp. HTCC2649]|uniref:universal stress protein n=1 Tax=Janibacter sp. HTCC2649 TaxID=313589 RepID=UPI000322979E|nr:universal stress protein [Janibacter sp. HTCC2649]
MRGRRPVVVGVDSGHESWLALGWAADEATRRGRPLHLIHARTSSDRARPEGVDAQGERLAPTGLNAAVAQARTLAPGIEVTAEATDQTPVRALTEASSFATCVVVGARGRGALVGTLLGSTSAQLTVHAACPVVVVRCPAEIGEGRPTVVVGVDGSALSSAAIGYAFARAADRGIPLTVVHACPSRAHGSHGAYVPPWQTDDPAAAVEREQAATAEEVAGWAETFPDVRVRRHVLRGDPASILVDHSRGAELLVVGSRGFGGMSGRLVGSVSQAVLGRAHCPVVVVQTESSTQRSH